MLREALRVALTVIMKNYVYTFDGKVRKRSKGVPIGLKLMGVLAQIFMLWWNGELASRLRTFGIVLKMYERYVDDINIAAKATRPGLKYRDVQVIMEDVSIEEDEKLAPDERTMELIKQIGDDIHPSIQLEIDYPSRHSDKKLPILDLKVWVEDREREKWMGLARKYHCSYFCTKDVSSKAVINARSAVSEKSKRTVLTQEVLRVLLNTSTLLPWSNVVKKVEEMTLRMQFSGYSKRFR